MAGPLLIAAALLAQGPQSPLAGYWSNPSASVVVLVAPCPDEGWCGTVTWSSDKAAADAARAGTTKLVGTEILHGFVAAGENRWKGRLFVPDLNRRSKVQLRLIEGDRLEVRGCAVGGLLCKSQVWTRSEPR
jgi:uncharacterized protein (DUF2147 family)